MSEGQFQVVPNKPRPNPEDSGHGEQGKKPVIFQQNYQSRGNQDHGAQQELKGHEEKSERNQFEEKEQEKKENEAEEKASETEKEGHSMAGSRLQQNGKEDPRHQDQPKQEQSENEFLLEPQGKKNDHKMFHEESEKSQIGGLQQNKSHKLATPRKMENVDHEDPKIEIESRKEEKSHDFNWGQEDDQTEGSKPRRSFSEFFLNSNLAKSQELLHEGKGKLNEKKNVLKKMDDEVDIWKDLRQSMLEKSRISQLKNSSIKSIKNQPKKGQIAMQKSDKLQNLASPPPASKKAILKIGRQEQKQKEAVDNIESMNKMIMEKVKKWKKEQREIEARRINQLNSSQEKAKLEMQREQEELEQMKSAEKKSRVKAISERLQKKLKRKLSSTSPHHKDTGKQKVKEKKSKTEKNYPKGNASEHKLNDKSKGQQQFSIHWNRKDSPVLPPKQKLLRRKIFEQKVRDLPVNVNTDKKLQMAIQIDKRANPLKYQFLNKKGYTDEEVFKEHKDFQLPQSPKKIGIKYLQDIREKNKIDDLRRYMSQQSLLNIKKHERHWKSPILEVLKPVEPAPKPMLTKQQQKRKKLYQQDDQYLGALRK